MKKVLALALALCMVFAMSAVAFAANEVIKKDTEPQTGNVVVKTALKEGGNPSDYDSYEVTIPADVTFEWDAVESQVREAKVKYELAEGSSLNITVAYVDNDAEDGLECEMAGLTTVDYAGYGVVADPATALKNTFTMTKWDASPGVYTVGTATYTVTYKAAV